jgi:hypothetical protein
VRSDIEHYADRRGIAAIMTGIFLAPLMVPLNYQLNYMLVPFACESGWWLALHGAPPIALAIALYGFLTARRVWHDAGSAWPDEEHGVLPRTRFLGVFGMLFSAVAIAVIAAQWIPSWIMSPCVR